MIILPQGKTISVPLIWPYSGYRVSYGEYGSITLTPINEED